MNTKRKVRAFRRKRALEALSPYERWLAWKERQARKRRR